MTTISLYNEYLKLLDGNKIPPFLDKYLTVPSLVRLKNIGYFCGMDYASKHVYDFKEKISRYDHSLSVALLTWKMTKDKTATIAGLFHDIATPCFSHVIDYMNKDYENQESTEEYTGIIIESDNRLQECLKADGIETESIIDFKQYPIVDNDRPKLCADRLDGIILTGFSWTKTIDRHDIIDIVTNLEIYDNEFGEIELGFKDENVAKKALNTSREIDILCHSSEDNYMMELLALMTSIAIEDEIITYDDLYYIDELTLLNKIRTCSNSKLKDLLDQFENIKAEDIPETIIDSIKMRKLDPLVKGKRLSKI